MKSIYQSGFYIILAFCFQSCGKSFLDAPPQNIYPRETISDLEDCEKVLRGVYANFSSAYGTYGDIYPELVTDNIKPSGTANHLLAAYNWMQYADDSNTPLSRLAVNMNGFSYSYYNIVRSSNFIVEKAEEFKSQNQAKAHNIIAAALTFRAYAYFTLVNVFAQPYNYTPQATHPGVAYSTSGNWTDLVQGRATVAEVYGHIIEDLQRAAAILHDHQPATTLLVNKSLPIALLSRVMLAAEKHNESLQYSKDCINICPLLEISKGYPDDVFKKIQFEDNEVMFHLVPLSSNSLGFSSGAAFSNLYYRLIPDFRATKDIADILNENQNDIRKNWVTSSGMVNKFPLGAVSDINPPHLSYFQPLIRTSEMYLNAAECCYHLNEEDNARYYLNRIIRRADPSAPEVSASGPQLLDSIRKERRKELAFEGLRLFDLQRWKLPITRSDANSPDHSSLILPNDKAIAPIPKQDLRVTGMTQNPGY